MLFDKEYSTQWDKEVNYLKANGIWSTFVRTAESGIKTYKYTKNTELFKTLYEFYKQNKLYK